jgi:ABC-type transport system involved in Fe-S cluster assembly fused permease/ATPase subunit
MNRFLNGEITLGTVIFIYTTYGGLLGQMYSFMHGIKSYYRTKSEFESLFKYSKIENEIKDKPDAKELSVKTGEIEFNKVTFK